MQRKGEYPMANKFRITMAEITDTIPFTKPMERSIPPVMITKVSPAAKSKDGDELIKILFRVLLAKKPLPTILKITHKRSRKMITQFFPNLRYKFWVVFTLSIFHPGVPNQREAKHLPPGSADN